MNREPIAAPQATTPVTVRLFAPKEAAIWSAPSASYHVTNWSAEEWARMPVPLRPGNAIRHDNGSWSLLEVRPPLA